MNRSSSADEKMLQLFLRTVRFRHEQTPKNYAWVLSDFQRFVSDQSAGAPPSASIVQRWLRDRHLNRKWPLQMVIYRARLVERFLEWLQARGAILTNPFSQLHRDYGWSTTPIVRAMLHEDTEVALQALRLLPRFGSFMGKLMEEHVARMRLLGYRYDTNEALLLRFDRFVQSRPQLTGLPLNKLVEAWSESHPCPQHLCDAQTAGRLISKAMHRLDPSVPILSFGTGVRQRARQQHRQPYVYTDQEIQRVLQSALSLPSPMAPLRPLTLYTMLILAYCAGLRLGEIVALTLADVDPQNDTIDIREAKFFKHRRLPLAPGVMAVLKHYLAERQNAGAPMSPRSSLFWSPQRGCRYSCRWTSMLLVEILRRAGLKPKRGQVGPRVHDLRHTMASHRLRDWYKSGINPQSKLPYLATFLGHKDIQSTLVYLHMTPELLQEASERFRKHGAKALQATGASR
jgi:integrase/recombinase XerD